MNLGRSIVVLSAFVEIATGLGREVTISPDGRDSSTGTRKSPFATLMRARDALRSTPQGEPRILRVLSGTYTNAFLNLKPEDSGLTILGVGPSIPVLLGGQDLGPWQETTEGFWSASLPDFPAFSSEASRRNPNAWEVRALVVNGQWRPRARYPAEGKLTHATRFDVPWMSSTGGGWKRPPTEDELTTLQWKNDDVPASLDFRNAEVTVFHMWDESCVGISSMNAATKTLRLSPACGHPPGAFGIQTYVIWNTREGLLRPGQWYHDRTAGRIVYRPVDGEQRTTTIARIPALFTLLNIEGQPDQHVRNIRVEGLRFELASVPLRTGGFAAASLPGAISVENAESCEFRNVEVRNVAGHAFDSPGAASDIRVLGCQVQDCGAGGIYVGGRGIRIEDNRILRIGLAYPSSIGIYRGGDDCLIAHNEVGFCPYSAINYGGSNVRVENNLLYRCMEVLHDGAAIYMFGGNGCAVRENVARDISDNGGYGASAYYLDEQSSGCVVERNISLNVARPSHNHMATNNVIRWNVFLNNGNIKLTFPRSSGFDFSSNIVRATGTISIEGSGAVTNWTGSVFWAENGKFETSLQNGYSIAATTNTPPTGVLVADPRFRAWKDLGLALRPDSPLQGKGYPILSTNLAGPRPPSQRTKR